MADTGTSPHNISTEHQKPGDAKRPDDSLDSGLAENTSDHVGDFNPGEDAGKPLPSGNPVA